MTAAGALRRGRRWMLAGGCLLVVAVLVAVGRPLLLAANGWLDVSQPPAKADYAYVLGGGPNSRPLLAKILFEQGWVSRILLSNVAPSPAVRDSQMPAEHEVTQQVLLARGVPAEKIEVIGHEHHTTYDEVLTLAARLEREPAARVIVVTSDFHCRRTRWIFRHVLGSRAAGLTFIGAPSDDYDPQAWWHSQRGFSVVLGEYAKLLAYQFRYSAGPYFLLAGGLGLCGIWCLRRRWFRKRPG